MVLSTTKRCQSIQSITNNICNLGGPKKGGLVTMQGRNSNLSNVITTRAPYCNCGMPLGCIPGLAYLKAKNLMTMNPQCSGGVPHRMYRGCRSSDASSGSSAPAPNTDIQLSSIATELTIPSGATLIIPVGLTLTIIGTVINNGTITNNGTIINNNNTITNNGTINNNSGGTITNNGSINNNIGGTINANSGSIFTNSGTVANNGTFVSNGGTINNTGTIGPNPITIALSSIATFSTGFWRLNAYYTIQVGYSLTISASQSFITNYQLTNYGSITNNGTIFVYTTVVNGNIQNYSTLNNDGGTIQINIDNTFTNQTGGTLNNKNGGTITYGGDGELHNYGGTINNNAGCTINVTGGLANQSPMVNNGTININAGGALNNSSTITNNGIIKNNGGTVINMGTIAPNPVT